MDTQRGFTLTELVVVIVIIGALMVTIIPRLNTGLYDAEATAERLAADARYAQSLAMTRARPHGIVIDGAGWRIVDDLGITVPAADGRTANAFGNSAASGFSGTIQFSNVLGQPDIGADVTVTLTQGGHSVSVVVRTLTGYAEVQ